MSAAGPVRRAILRSFTVLTAAASLLPAIALAGTWQPPAAPEAICPGATPGAVHGLRVESYDPATAAMDLTYEPACAAADHHIEYGPLSQVATLGYGGQQCGLGTSGSVPGFQPGPDSYFFLVVASNGSGQAGSYGLMERDGAAVERPANLSQSTCSFAQDLSAACDAPAPVFTIGLTAYRPQTESYGAFFQRTAVPAEDLADPGVGVRVNGDDDDGSGTPDRDETAVAGENDLVEVVLSADPPCVNGIDWVLSRSGPGLQVWADPDKQTPILVAGDEAVLFLSGPSRTVWVESVQGGSGDLAFQARNDSGGVILSRTAHFYSISSIVIALGGESQVPGDPPPEPSNYGTFQLAIQLYRLGYDVHMYDEDVVASDGSGAAYNEVVSAVQNREVGQVAIFGYSHGGGSTVDLAIRLNDNAATVGAFDLVYTAYMDGIGNNSDTDLSAETELPPGTMYHANYYQRLGPVYPFIGCRPCGSSVAGADIEVYVNGTPWGTDLDHYAIDDAPEVLGAIRDHILTMVTP